MALSTVEAIDSEIARLSQTAHEVRQEVGSLLRSVTWQDEHLPSGEELTTWITTQADLKARLGVTRELITALDQTLEALKHQRRQKHDSLADNEVAALLNERAKLADELSNGNWLVDKAKAAQRIAEINRIFTARKYGL